MKVMDRLPRAFFSFIVYLVASGALAENQKLSLTIYNNDLAFVQDKRTIDFVAGISRIELKDVSAQIHPETVAFTSPGISIVEQNFDFDLLTPEKLMQKAVGQQVQIVRINPGNGTQVTETATVLSANNGVVLRIGDHIEVLNADAIPTRVIFNKMPENLRATPTLSVMVDSSNTGARSAVLSYLTGGLSWQADYVALFDEKISKLDLQGWITLSNHSGTTYTDAETQLIAGKINSTRSALYVGESSNQPWRVGAGSDTNPKNVSPFADYYLYTLPSKTTIANQQTKQIGFLEANGVSAEKSYRYRANGFMSYDEPVNAEVVIQFKNSAEDGLSAPLPAGVVRVYVRDPQGVPKFIGENRIDHAPKGSTLGIQIGEAFDVSVQSTLIANEQLSSKRRRYSMEYLVRNARSENVVVEVDQSATWRDGKIISENIKSSQLDAYRWRWDVPVKSHDETKLSVVIEVKQ